jgi:hypothetical protein
VPEIEKGQRTFGTAGKTFVTDCKGAALATRAYLAQSGDYYLCPLPQTQRSAEQRRALLQPVWQGRQALQRVYRPAEDGPGQELVAEGFFLDVPLRAEVNGRWVSWTERRWLVRSLALAAGQHQQLDRRLRTAQEQLARLNERQQGKKRLTAQEMAAAAEEVIEKQRVQGLLNWRVKTSTPKRRVRRYGDRPERVHQEREHRLEVSVCQEAVAQAKREMGWRAYAENQRTLNLAAVVWGYRGQNRLEGNWSRLKGQPLGLTPLYLQYESRVIGLVLLLSLGLRVLSVLEWTVRKELEEKEETLRGLYAGQAGRATSRPSAELLLRAFKGISLVVVEVAGQLVAHITALTALQHRLLGLWGLPPELYHRLTLPFPEPPSG